MKVSIGSDRLNQISIWSDLEIVMVAGLNEQTDRASEENLTQAILILVFLLVLVVLGQGLEPDTVLWHIDLSSSSRQRTPNKNLHLRIQIVAST